MLTKVFEHFGKQRTRMAVKKFCLSSTWMLETGWGKLSEFITC